MSLWTALFGGRQSDRRRRVSRFGPRFVEGKPFALCTGNGEYSVNVVGELRYQNVLEAVSGGRCEDGVEVETYAELVFEDDNPHDENAIGVFITARKVGYLTREDALEFRQQFASQGITAVHPILCKAQIRGGWDRGEDDRGHFGVFLDLDSGGEDV